MKRQIKSPDWAGKRERAAAYMRAWRAANRDRVLFYQNPDRYPAPTRPRKSRSEYKARERRHYLDAFLKWCSRRSIDPLLASPETIEDYLKSIIPTTSTYAAIHSVCSAVDRWFVICGCDLPPTRSERVRVIKRKLRELGRPPIVPLSDVEMSQMMDACPRTLIGLRDSAIISMARMRVGPKRLALLTVADCLSSGMATREVRQWLDAAGVTDGLVFRHVRSNRVVSDCGFNQRIPGCILKQRASAAGINPAGVNFTAAIKRPPPTASYAQMVAA